MVADLERYARFYTDGMAVVVCSRLPGRPGPAAAVLAPREAVSRFVLLRQRDQTASIQPSIEVGNG